MNQHGSSYDEEALTRGEFEAIQAALVDFRDAKASPATERRCVAAIRATLERLRLVDPLARPVPLIDAVCAGNELRVAIGRGHVLKLRGRF